jgi:hypothetical protein
MRLAVAVVVAFAAVAVNPNPAPAAPPIDCYQAPNVGECPPLSDEDGSCWWECRNNLYPNGGQCMPSGCCACFL